MTTYVIESIQASEIDNILELATSDKWEEWCSDSNPAELLRDFVNAVSESAIDDVNHYWRVREEVA